MFFSAVIAAFTLQGECFIFEPGRTAGNKQARDGVY